MQIDESYPPVLCVKVQKHTRGKFLGELIWTETGIAGGP